jgi:hypothetical protein
MQIELFQVAPAVPGQATTARKRKPSPQNEPTSKGFFTFETWVSWPARAVNADDGLRIEFSVPVHFDLLEAVNNPDKREITCKYRVRQGFKWSGLGRQASVKIEAHLTEGPKGGLYLHCKNVEILEPKPIPRKPTKAQLTRWEKASQPATEKGKAKKERKTKTARQATA